MPSLKTHLLTGFLSALCALHSYADTEKLVIYAEDARPYAYLSAGRVRGPMPDFVRLVAQKAGYDPEIRLSSWTGIINRTVTEKSVIFFPMARTPEREEHYQWLGSIAVYKTYNLYKKKTRKDIVLHNLDNARKFRIGVLTNSAREMYLFNNGFKELASGDSSGLVRLVNNNDGLRLLKLERIDLLPLSIVNFELSCKPDCEDYEVAMTLDISLDLELAATKGVSSETIARLKNAFLSLQKDGTQAKILGNH